EPSELASIEGFDADTASEIQSRAQGHLARIEAEFDEKRIALGVADELKTVEGLTTPMLVKLGENDVKTLDDLAGCATDDLVGWTERKEGGEQTKFAGAFEGLDVSRDDAEAMIMQARVKAGWITEADLAKPAEEAETAEDQPA